jgi:DNA-binding response OmpR family regulator
MSENKISVLLIEDDIFLSELCTIKLEEAQYQVDLASDGQEGLNKLLQKEYQVVLLDIMLPKLTGFEVLEQYQQKKSKDITAPMIIMMTNLSDQNQITKALKLGAKDYIVKAHYSPTEIVTKITELLSQV